jgi:phosphoribosylformimino-5-aminoimidazole carboxamide ribonucleotide (ProFAR) isomerase
MNNPAWHLEGDGKQGYYYYWPNSEVSAFQGAGLKRFHCIDLQMAMKEDKHYYSHVPDISVLC